MQSDIDQLKTLIELTRHKIENLDSDIQHYERYIQKANDEKISLQQHITQYESARGVAEQSAIPSGT